MSGAGVSLQSYVTAPVNYVLMRGLLSAARRVLPYFNGTVPGELQKAGGSASVKWRRIANLALQTSALSEIVSPSFGMGRTLVTPTVSSITQAVSKYGNPMTVNEEVDLINPVGNIQTLQLIDNLGENAGASMNAVTRNEFGNATNKRYAAGVATDTLVKTAITVADIRYVVNQLNRNSAMKHFPMGTGSQNVNTGTVRASYFGICHPDTEEEIRSFTNFLGVEQYGGYTQTLVGEFGAIGGVRFCASEIAQINSEAGVDTPTSNIYRGTSDNANDIYETHIYGREAVGTVGLGDEFPTDIKLGGPDAGRSVPAVQLLDSGPPRASAADPLAETRTIAWKAWHAAKVLNENWLFEVRHLVRTTDNIS